MTRLFTENRALMVFLLPIFTVGYLLLNLFFPHTEVTNELNLGLWGTYTLDDIFLKRIAGAMLVFLNAIGINFVFNHYNLHEKSTYLPGFIYIVWISFFEVMYNPNGFLISHTALILMLFQLFQLNQNEDGRKIVFNAAFLAGIATCFHLTAVVILPFLFIMVWIIRPFVLRESLLLLAGFITPLLYAGVLMLFQNKVEEHIWEFQVTYLWFERTEVLVYCSFALLYIFLSFWGIRGKLQKSSIRFRKLIRILWTFIFFSVCLGILDLLLFQRIEFFSLVFVVTAVFSFFSFFQKSLSFITNSLFLIIIISSILKFFL